MTRERYQNPVVGEEIRLQLLSYNSNNLADLRSIDTVEIFYIDPTPCSSTCPDGKRLVETFNGSSVTQTDTGRYQLVFTPNSPLYVVGKYQDSWNVTATDDQIGQSVNCFQLFPNLWYFSTIPAVYSFDFTFQPNRFRQGSIKYLIIKITPNVPRATDLERYYTNLAISSTMRISIEKACGPCDSDTENDLRLIVDRDLVEEREKVFGYYKLDTTDMDCGIYNVWVELQYSDILEISPKSQIQIY